MRALALTRLDQACRGLEHGALSVQSVREAYIALEPLGHGLCRDDHVDLPFLARAYALGGARLFAAPRVVVRPVNAPVFPHVRPLDDGAELVLEAGAHAAGDATMLLCGLHIESEKVAHRLGRGPAPGLSTAASLLGGDIAALFDDAQHAQGFLHALATVPAERWLGFAAPPAPPEDEATLERDALLIVGGGAHELFSPYVRRLAPRLKKLGGEAYEGMSLLFTESPDCAQEMREVERQDGIVPTAGGLLIKTQTLRADLVDGRLKSALTGLHRARWDVLVGPPDPRALPGFLMRHGSRVVGTILIAPGLGFAEPYAAPRLLGSTAFGAPWVRLDNPLSAPDLARTMSAPSLAVASDGASYNTGLYDALGAVTGAMARGHLADDVPLCPLVFRANDRDAQHQAVLAGLAQRA